MKQYLEVKDAHVHDIGRLAVGQEGHMVEDAAHRPVRGRRFGLGGQGRSIWVYGPVQVSHQTISNQGYYTVLLHQSYLGHHKTNLCAVKLSQKVMLPSQPRVRTQA